MSEIFVAPHVRWAEVQGRVCLLDLRAGRYFGFDPVASFLWRRLAETRSREVVFGEMRERFDAEPDLLATDIDEFIGRALEAGHFSREAAAPDPEVPTGRMGARRFLTMRAWWSLFRTARRGFAETYSALSRLPFREGKTALDRAVRAFARAENFFHLRRAPEDCLPRSLALFGFLRRLGIPAEHRIGVQMFPFFAHAWVECGGKVVHDDPSVRRRFAVIASLPGRAA
jgi:hypothetical protein